jgi:hypothetical protein
MGVTTLPAWHVEDACPDGKPKKINYTRRLLAIALGCEERAVLQEIVGIERGLPPLTSLSQKNTGSR